MKITDWLLNSDEPWTRYRTLVDLLDLPQESPEVQAERAAMLNHAQVLALREGACWPAYALTRHNDSAHPLYKLSTLADFGLQASDLNLKNTLAEILAHASPQGAFQTQVNIPTAFGGTGEASWTWLACDAPTLLYTLLAMGETTNERVQQAAQHLASLALPEGWGCTAAPELGKFKGPGKHSDPCPIANLYALKALSLLPEQHQEPAARTGVEMLLNHWTMRNERKYFLFAMGSDFAKLKFPYIWYDILHVVEVLSRFDYARHDPRLEEMLAVILSQADEQGAYTANSMYQAWKGWSFANKKAPSPWLTFLVLRIQKRFRMG